MTASMTFHPLGNADCTRIDLADGRKLLIDYADMRNPDDRWDNRVDLPSELKADLRLARRDYFDTVCFTHLDNDHCCGSDEFFWWDHAKKYQAEGRIKVKTLWVPAGAILEEGCADAARVIRQEARHRLREGYGIRVFSRPGQLKTWLADNGLTLEDRAHLIVDAGKLVPDYSLNGPERAEFFVHSPFAWRVNENEVIDRNNDSIVFQATFNEGAELTRALFMSDIDYGTIDLIVKASKRYGNAHRLEWDIFKVPHHSSYTAIGPDKGVDETKPTAEVKWLCEEQGQERSIMISTSWSIPAKGSAEDDDVQPPHRQAANYYERVADSLDGQYKVTMDLPNKGKPRPSVIKMTSHGAELVILGTSTAGAASVTSTTARAG